MIARHDKNSTVDIWARLAEPVPQDQIQWRADGKVFQRDGKYFARFVAYTDAQFVRERLDAVVPGEWDLTIEMLPHPLAGLGVQDAVNLDAVCSFKARIQILGVIREDVGHGKDYKEAATDAFKRAAMRFGIAHELWSYEQNWVEVDGDGRYPKPLEDPAQAYARRYNREPGVTAAAAQMNDRDLAAARAGNRGPNRMWLETQIAAPGALTLEEADYISRVLANPEYSDGQLAGLVTRTKQSQADRGYAAPAPNRSGEQRPSPTTPAATSAGAPSRSTADAPNGSAELPACPKCGGRMWDNRMSKRNPKAPDFKCRDRSCDGVIWPPRPSESQRRDDGGTGGAPAYAGDPGDSPFPPAIDSAPLGMTTDDIPF